MGQIKNLERLATFLRVNCVVKPAILYSKYQFLFLSQAPQAQNTWCMRQLVYIENCMEKSPIMKIIV